MPDPVQADRPEPKPFVLHFAIEFDGTVEEFEAGGKGTGQETLFKDG
jgi:hypothetical protein